MSVKSSGGGLFFDAGVNLDRLKRELGDAYNAVGQFTNRVGRDGAKVGSAFNESTKGANLFNASLGTMNSNLGMLVGTAAGVGAVTILTRQLMGLAKQAREFSGDFELAMKEVQTISRAVQEDFDGISKAIVGMGANGPDDALQLAKAYYQIVSAGYDGAEGLRLLDVASRASTAGITDTLTAADGLTTVMNAWGKSMSEAEMVADVMFKTVEKGKTTFPELASSIAQVAPIASSLKIPFEDIMALTASITKQGTPTAQAMTQIRGALVGLAKEYGGAVFEGRSLQDTFEAVAEASEYSIDKLIKVVGRVEGANAILATTGTKLAEAKSDLEAMTEAAGAMGDAYGRMMEAAENKWLVVHNRWTRELKEFGDYLLRASGGIADLLNAMLEDREIDIIAPTVQKEIDNFAASLSGITDQEEKLRIIQERIIQIRQETKNLAEEERGLEKKAPGALRKGIEAFNAGIGMGDAFQSGRVNEAELAVVRENIEVNERVEKELAKLFEQTLNPDQEPAGSADGGTGEGVLRSLSVMSAELQKLKDELGTGTAEQDVAIIRQMAKLNEEIERYHQNVREGLGGAENSKILETGQLFAKRAKIEIDSKKEVLKPTQQLTKEEEERLKLLQKQEDILVRQAELIDGLAEGFEGTSEILGSLSFAVGEIDRDLGEIVGRMADVAYNASQLFTAIGAKDPISAIASGIGLIGNVFGMLKQDESDQLNKGLVEINRTLERQSALLSQISGQNWFDLATKQVNDYKKAIGEAEEALRSSIYVSPEIQKIIDQLTGRPYSGAEITRLIEEHGVNTAGWSVDDFVKAVADGIIDLREAGNDILMQALADREAMIDLVNEGYARTLGFTSDEVADAIVSGVESGLYDSEAHLSGFADSFGGLLRTTFQKNIISALNDEFLLTFMERFNESMKDGTMDETERQALESLYVNAVDQAKQMWDNIAPILNDYTNQESDRTGLAGAIRGITEETGGLIAGQFYAMREIQQRTYLLFSEQLNNTSLMLSHLAGIEANTSYNRNLEQLRDDIFEMKNVIKERL